MRTIIQYLHRLEDSLLVGLLSLLIILASAQIFMRNVLDTGIVWIDPLLRVMVLWLSLIGAAVAARELKHIQIDVLTRLLNPRVMVIVGILVNLFSATVCLVIAWSGASWIMLDYEDQITGILDLPAWILEIIIPVSFGVIGLRFLGQAFTDFSCITKPENRRSGNSK